jgi:hypothetical protein
MQRLQELSMTSLFLVVITAVSHAVPVFIAPFEALDKDAEALAERLPAILGAELAGDPSLEVLDPVDFPDVGDITAELYLEVCPPGQMEGCAYVVGEAGGASYALLGTVRTLEPDPLPVPQEGEELDLLDAEPEPPPIEREITLKILDVAFYNEVLEVVLVHTEPTEESFADAVPWMLQDAASGEVGGEVDIRTTVPLDLGPEDEQDKEERDLDSLSAELGEVDGRGDAQSTSAPRREDRPRKRRSDLEDEDPSTWRELGLTSQQYLAWWNSGWDLASWSRRLDGRRGQILLRAHGGLGLVPTHGLYHGRVSYYGDQLTLEQIYVTHELSSGLGSHAGLSVGYGLTPTLELEGGGSREGGRYEVDVKMVYRPLGTEAVREASDDPQGTPQVWVGARWVPGPASTLRPVVGAGVAWWFGHTLSDDQLPMYVTPAFTSPLLTSLRLLGGAELRLMPGLDAVLQVPIHLIVAGQDPAVYDELRIEGPEYGMDDMREPGKPFPVAASLQLGIQARLGGRGAKDRGPQAFDEELEELD